MWRGAGRPKTAGHRWVGTPSRTFTFGSVSRPSGLRFASASLAASLLQSMDGMSLHTNTKRRGQGRTDVPSARRPVRISAATNARVRSRSSSHRRQAIGRSPVVLRYISGIFFQAQRSPLWVGGRPLCLRVCDGAWWFHLRYLRDLWAKRVGGRLCDSSVSLCLCGSPSWRLTGVETVS